MTRRTAAVIAALSCVGISARGGATGPTLPATLRGYRWWVAGDVHAVSVPLEYLCMALPPGEFARRRAELQRAQGPHAERYVRMYANPIARSAGPDAPALPAGSILVKEKLRDPHDAQAESVAFMIKRAPGTRPASGDWEFRYFPEPRNADYAGCVECHRTGATRDYVFSPLKRSPSVPVPVRSASPP